MDSRYLDSLTSFIGDEASKAVESTPQVLTLTLTLGANPNPEHNPNPNTWC